jgi:hypothetical protein
MVNYKYVTPTNITNKRLHSNEIYILCNALIFVWRIILREKNRNIAFEINVKYALHLANMNHNPLNNIQCTPLIPNLIQIRYALVEIQSYIRTEGQTGPQILFRVGLQKGTKNDALARKISDPDLTQNRALWKIVIVKLWGASAVCVRRGAGAACPKSRRLD